MMKRSALLLIPLMVGLVSCDNSSGISNQETVDKIKELLSKQDLSEFHSKTLKGTYTQDYDVLEISENDEGEKVSNYFNYLGYGMLGYYYNLTNDEYNSIVDEKGNIETFDAIATGTGSYDILQISRTMSFSREGSWESKINNLDFFQSLTLKTTEQDVWVYNSLDVTDHGSFDGDSTQRFNSSINKELLLGSVSIRTFREIFSKVDLFNTPGNVEHLDKLYFSICRELVSKNDKEISDFVSANQVSVKEEDNIEVNFVFSNEDIDEEEADYIFPGAIKGTLKFDKGTYQFLNFNYEMLYKMETYDEETGNIKFINTKFTCSGESTHDLPDDSWEPTNPKVYDDVAEFLNDVREEVVPPNIYL